MKIIWDFIKGLWAFTWWFSVTLIVWFPIFVTGYFSKTGKFSFRICQLWVWIAKGVTFSTIETVPNPNLDKSKSYVIVSNHQSLLDIPVLMLNLGLQFRWVLKKELGFIPGFGWALWGAKHIFVDRGSPKQALKNLTKSLQELPPGVSIAVFPEGTRANDGVLGDFKIGAFLTAISAGIPVLPVTINGSYKRMPNKNSLAFNPGKIQLVVGEPIDSTKYAKREISKLMKDAKAAVAANLNPDYPEINQ